MVDSHGSALTASLLPSDTFASKDHFKAGLVGNIDSDATNDVWTIDDTRNIVNVTNDCDR